MILLDVASKYFTLGTENDDFIIYRKPKPKSLGVKIDVGNKTVFIAETNKRVSADDFIDVLEDAKDFISLVTDYVKGEPVICW